MVGHSGARNWNRRSVLSFCFGAGMLILSTSTRCNAFSSLSPFHQRRSIPSLYESARDGAPDASPVTEERKSGYNTEEGYSRYVVSKKRKNRVLKMRDRILREFQPQRDSEDDDFTAIVDEKVPLLSNPFKRLTRKMPEPGTLILIRAGESVWNANNTFTGWADPDLSDRGHREMEHAARLLVESGYEIDVVFTSRLKRAIRSVWTLLLEINRQYLPVFKSWRLNERNYGALTGTSKAEAAAKLGVERVQQWRHSLKARPPPLDQSSPYWPGRERKFADLELSQIPLTESLADCMERAKPVWDSKILYELGIGRTALVVAHGNTVRGLIKLIDGLSDDDIEGVAIPPGIPIVYKFDKGLNPIKPTGDSLTAAQHHMSGMFLEKPGLLIDALKREEEWRNNVPGYEATMARSKTPLGALEHSLTKLVAERELGEWAAGHPNELANHGNNDVHHQNKGSEEVKERAQRDLVIEYHAPHQKERVKVVDENNEEIVSPAMISSGTYVAPVPSDAAVPGGASAPTRKDSVIVMIRHGKTEHNKLGLFTGWEDAPLAPEGKEEAKEAGRLLKMHGFQFDVVYSSWLSRATETAWHVMDQLDSLWLPIIKSWRLNERMYGGLTGKSKRMVARQHGEATFKAWRRGFKVRPPRVSSFCPDYPGNDVRYKNLHDVRFSFTESLMRSIDNKRIILHRKLPKTESLHDCMKRTIPYYTNQIVPEAVETGKRVLIASSENAIRGLLKHLCDIPEEKIVDLEIPNGLPLIYDLKSKCVKLLDDGSGIHPLEKYNFGKADSYLFRPRLNEDGTPDEEYDIRFVTDGIWESKEEEDTKSEVSRPLAEA